jgi:hypothetical protein
LVGLLVFCSFICVVIVIVPNFWESEFGTSVVVRLGSGCH